MNLKQKLAALRKEAEGLMPKVEVGEKAALERASELADEIEALEAAIKEAEEFKAKVGSIGVIGGKSHERGEDAPAKSWASSSRTARRRADSSPEAASPPTSGPIRSPTHPPCCPRPASPKPSPTCRSVCTRVLGAAS